MAMVMAMSMAAAAARLLFSPAPTVAAAFRCGAEQALAMATADTVGHRNVDAVAQMARETRDSYPETNRVPPGCCAVLRKGRGTDWETEWTAVVRSKIEELSARCDTHSRL